MSDVAEKIKQIVVEHLGVEESKVTPEASFIDDLGADSLDTVELVMAFEEAFGVEIPDDAAEKITTVKDAIAYIEKPEQAKAEGQGRRGQACSRTEAAPCGVWSSPAWASHARSALGVEQVWKRPGRTGESGISAIQSFDTKDLPCKDRRPGAGRRSKADGKLDLERVDPGQGPEEDGPLHPASPSWRAVQAVEDSGWMPENEEDRCATGVMIGSGIGGLQTIHEASQQVAAGQGFKRISPFFIPSALINLASGHLSPSSYGFKGPNHSVVTACATGVHAHGRRGASHRLSGDADVMVAGGAEAAVCGDSAWPASAPRAPCPPASTTGPRPRPAPGTRIATASSWARAPASWCWRSTSTPRSAARRSTPRSAATACPATPSTSPPPPRATTAPIAP